MLNTIFSPWPCFNEEEAQAVHSLLLSNRVNYWTGTECRKFETSFAAWVGSRYAVALANGTLALDVALKALGVGSGDEVVVTPRTFIASVSCVVNAGAKPVFADVDINSGNITAETIKSVLSSRTKAIICVHLAGWPCDMDPIMDLAKQHGIMVIEDCAQAHGALYKGRMVGSIGHVGAWSFCQDKIMTTGGEGGMVTTNNQILWSKMWSYKDHGKSYEAVYEREHPPGFRWLHESIGTNWRMLEMQAVIGIIQLKRMPEWIAKRQKNASSLVEALLPFSGDGGIIRIPTIKCSECNSSTMANCKKNQVGCLHAYYKLYAYVQPQNLSPNWTRDRIIDAINSKGVPCYQGTCSEVYLEKAFDGTGIRPEHSLKVAKELGDTSIMFLVHPTLTDSEILKTCNVIKDVLTEVISC